MHIFLPAFNLWCCCVVSQLPLQQIWAYRDCLFKNVFSVAPYILMGNDIRQTILHLTLTEHPWDQTRDMKPSPKLAGIWMVSNAREDGLNGKVTGKMCLASMSSWGESFLSLRRSCKDKKGIVLAFSPFVDNHHLAVRCYSICVHRCVCIQTNTLWSSATLVTIKWLKYG